MRLNPKRKKAIEQVLLLIAQTPRLPTAAEEIATRQIKMHSTPAPPTLPTLSAKVLVEFEKNHTRHGPLSVQRCS